MMDAQTEAAWEAFAEDAAAWVDEAGEALATIAARHGVDVTRHRIERRLELLVATFENRYSIRPADRSRRLLDSVQRARQLLQSLGVDGRAESPAPVGGVGYADARADLLDTIGRRHAEMAAKSWPVAERSPGACTCPKCRRGPLPAMVSGCTCPSCAR